MVEKVSIFQKELLLAFSVVLAVPMITTIFVGGGYVERLETLEELARDRTTIVNELRKDRNAIVMKVRDEVEGLRRGRNIIVEQVREEADEIVERMTSDYVNRDRRLWDRLTNLESLAAKDRERIAALQATMTHLSAQLDRIETKVDRVIEHVGTSHDMNDE